MALQKGSRVLTPRGTMKIMRVSGSSVLCARGGVLPCDQEWAMFAPGEIFSISAEWPVIREDFRAMEIAGMHFATPEVAWCSRIKTALQSIETALNVSLLRDFYAANDLCGRASDRERLGVA